MTQTPEHQHAPEPPVTSDRPGLEMAPTPAPTSAVEGLAHPSAATVSGRTQSALARLRREPTVWLVGCAVLAASCAAVLGGVIGPVAAYGFVAAAGVVVLVVVAGLYPVSATYTYLVTMPFLAGIDRGALIPLVRPSEGLLAVLMAGACLGGYLRILRGDRLRPRFYPLVDIPLAVFLLAVSIWPLASLTLRGQLPTGIDYASILPFPKLVALYFLVRYTITTEARILRTIRCIVWPGAGVALIGILQTLKFGPVLALLQTFWDSASGAYGSASGGGDASTGAQLSERGSATLGSPIAAGDVIIISLILVFCCAPRGLLGRRERLVLAMVLGAGTLASGQYSTWIAATVAGVLLFRRFPQLRAQAKRFAPLSALAVVIGFPAFLGRLDGIGEYGPPVPESWLGRYDNLTGLFLPHFTWLTTLIGVSPNEALNAPETWRDVVYLESGVLYFVWIGGIPLLAAFIWLSVRVLRASKPATLYPGPFGAAGSTIDIVWRFLLVVTLIDPHLQQRGTGDLIFTLLAITVTGLHQRAINVTRYPTLFEPIGNPHH